MKTDTHVEHGEPFSCDEGCLVGLLYRPEAGPARFGRDCRIRWGTVIYGDVVAGDDFQTGHHVMIREKTVIGNHVVVGTGTVIDGQVEIGDFVKIESQCYIPTHVRIGSRVFLGPGVTLTNDRYPLKDRANYSSEGPVIEDGVTLGARVVVCPGVRIGAGAFVAAGAVLTRDVPSMTLALGVPARHQTLPERLRERNIALSWKKHLTGGC